MFKTVTVDGNEMEFAANAATPFRYKQVFHKDLLAILGNEKEAEAKGVETITELAYIMHKQAEKADMSKLTYDEFIGWLEEYSPMAFVESAEEILSVYVDSAATTSTP